MDEAAAMRRERNLTTARDRAVEPVAHLASQGMRGAGAMLAASVLADSALEHYRGSFHNSFMSAPLASATLNLIASAHGAKNSGARDTARTAAYAASILTGLVGTGFHIYNVGKRVGGFRWENLFYGAPLGAPAALTLSGLAGLAAEELAAQAERRAPKILGLPAGRALAGFVSLGLIGTLGEVGLLHFRGAFQNPGMYLPLTAPPVAAALLAEAAASPMPRRRPLAKLFLRMTALLGVAGVGFHAYGVARSMGGWRNWRQTVVDGPPLPAPPAFSGLALAGLAALELIERGADD